MASPLLTDSTRRLAERTFEQVPALAVLAWIVYQHDSTTKTFIEAMLKCTGARE